MAKAKTTVNVNAYAKTNLIADAEKDVTLYLGSDDGIAVWLNGESVHQNLGACRCYGDRQDSVKIHLNKGCYRSKLSCFFAVSKLTLGLRTPKFGEPVCPMYELWFDFRLTFE